jgi:hypothetical protein
MPGPDGLTIAHDHSDQACSLSEFPSASEWEKEYATFAEVRRRPAAWRNLVRNPQLRLMNRSSGSHARVQFNFAERTFVTGDILLQQS